MTRQASARLAGATFLLYIAVWLRTKGVVEPVRISR
jgi:hypothetical protein